MYHLYRGKSAIVSVGTFETLDEVDRLRPVGGVTEDPVIEVAAVPKSLQLHFNARRRSSGAASKCVAIGQDLKVKTKLPLIYV